MADNIFSVRIHHKGTFLKTKYSGGQVIIMKDVDLDYLSYTVLMEDVKEKLKYDEIGGIYVNKGKMGGWTLLMNDKDLFKYIAGIDSKNLDFYIDDVVDKGIEPVKQCQPHIVVRPRPSPVKVNKPIANRKFVTLRDIQLEQQKKKKEAEEKLNARKKLPLLESCNERDDIYTEIDGEFSDNESTDYQDYNHEAMPNEELRDRIQQTQISAYEEMRQKNIQRNSERLAELNLPTLVSNLRPGHLSKHKEKVIANESEDYSPDNDSAHDTDGDEVNVAPVISKKTKRVVAMQNKEIRPITRSRVNIPIVAAKQDAGGHLVPSGTKKLESSKNV